MFDDNGRGRARARRHRIPGLYFLGLPWQHTRGSALLGWVKDDAEYIARAIEELPRGAERSSSVLQKGVG